MQIIKSRASVKVFVNDILIFHHYFATRSRKNFYIHEMKELFRGVKNMYFHVQYAEKEVTQQEKVRRAAAARERRSRIKNNP